MTDLTFYDASRPPASPPATDGVAFYIGGDTPHIWTVTEVKMQRARYRLPIYVRSNPAAADVLRDVSEAVAQLQHLNAPRGCLVAWDSETSADPHYMLGVFQHLQLTGYTLIDYGSQSSVFGNESPDGYYWGADWTNRARIEPGDAGTQFFSGRTYDLSVFRPGLPFWDTKTGAVTQKPINWQEHMMQQLPTIQQGATGDVVRTIQGLIEARGYNAAIDGDFGPDTDNAVRLIQGHAGITTDGIVGPQTWPVLLGIA